MPLDASIRRRLDAAVAAGALPAHQLTPEQARSLLAEVVAQQKTMASGDLAVANRLVPEVDRNIPVRVYQPKGRRPFPTVVFFHGGGWVNGTLDSHDQFCRLIARESEAVVVSVEYRRAPEHRFPAAPEDCLAATDWAIGHATEWQGEAGRVFVAGDSAGGNLAAVVAQMQRDRNDKPRLAGQILLSPVMAYYDPPTPSYLAYGEGYGLTRQGMIHFWDLYLSNRQQANHPYAAPLRAAEFGNLPPALVITAEYDVLRDEGEEYARRLVAAGLPVKHLRMPGVNHGFAAWPDADFELAQAKEARRTVSDWIGATRQ